MLEVRVWCQDELEDVQCFVHGPVTVGGVEADVYLSTEEGATPLFELDDGWSVVADERFAMDGGPDVPPEDEGRVVLRCGPWRIEVAVVEPPDPTWRERSWIGLAPILLYAAYLLTPWFLVAPPAIEPPHPVMLSCSGSALLPCASPPPARAEPPRAIAGWTPGTAPIAGTEALEGRGGGTSWPFPLPDKPGGLGPSPHQEPGIAWPSGGVGASRLGGTPGGAPPSDSSGRAAWVAAAEDPVAHVLAVTGRDEAARVLTTLSDGACPAATSPGALVRWFSPRRHLQAEVSRHPTHSMKRLLRVIVQVDRTDPWLGSVDEIEIVTNPTVVRAWRLVGTRLADTSAPHPGPPSASDRGRSGYAVALLELVVIGDPVPSELGSVWIRDREGTTIAVPRLRRGSLRDLSNSWAAGRLAEGLAGNAVDWHTVRGATTDPTLARAIEAARRCAGAR